MSAGGSVWIPVPASFRSKRMSGAHKDGSNPPMGVVEVFFLNQPRLFYQPRLSTRPAPCGSEEVWDPLLGAQVELA